MTSVPHEPSRIVPEKRLPQLLGTEMWASLAIIVIWLSVLADAIFGPELVDDHRDILEANHSWMRRDAWQGHLA